MLDRSNEPSQAAIDAVNLSRIRKAQELNGQAGASLRGICAAAQLQGLDLPDAKEAIKIAKGGAEAVEKFLDSVVNITAYLNYLGVPVQRAQLDLFEAAPQSAPEDEIAKAAGLVAGRLGDLENTNPHAANTPKGMAWLTGHRDGAAERAAVMAMAPPHPAEGDDDEADDDED